MVMGKAVRDSALSSADEAASAALFPDEMHVFYYAIAKVTSFGRPEGAPFV